jgi:hypothetical protein
MLQQETRQLVCGLKSVTDLLRRQNPSWMSSTLVSIRFDLVKQVPLSQIPHKSILDNHSLSALIKSAPIAAAPFSNAVINKSCKSSLQSRCLFSSGPKHSLSIAARSAALVLPPRYQQSLKNSHFCSSMAPAIADLGSAASFSTSNATGKLRKPRVVSLLPSACELLCFIPGGEEMLVGRGHEDDYPPSILDRPILTASKVNWTTSAGESSGVRDKRNFRCSAHCQKGSDTIGLELIWTAIQMVPSTTQAVLRQ